MQKKSILICLMGPTASGKTALAIDLIKKFPCEIISVDSAMVYRGMDIGTAKPSPFILEQAPHHLIDICEPNEAYSAAKFRSDALIKINDILERGRIPLLVGGTMLYFRALQAGLAMMPGRDPLIRQKITIEAEALGWEVMHQKLQAVDPVAAVRIHPHDSQRIQRALEVFMISGKNLTAWQADHVAETDTFRVLNIIIAPKDRAMLHERIAMRFKQMLAQGLIDEVKKLFVRKDLDLTMPAMRSVGYRQVWEYLEGKYSYDEMCEKGIIATRQLAKRQLTWLRSWPNAVWFDSSDELFDQVEAYLRSSLLTIADREE